MLPLFPLSVQYFRSVRSPLRGHEILFLNLFLKKIVRYWYLDFLVLGWLLGFKKSAYYQALLRISPFYLLCQKIFVWSRTFCFYFNKIKRFLNSAFYFEKSKSILLLPQNPVPVAKILEYNPTLIPRSPCATSSSVLLEATHPSQPRPCIVQLYFQTDSYMVGSLLVVSKNVPGNRENVVLDLDVFKSVIFTKSPFSEEDITLFEDRNPQSL